MLYKLIHYFFCKEMWLVVFPVHVLWHKISEAFVTWFGLIYVTAWLAVVFGINSVSNIGEKTVIVWGAAEHYYYFPAYITRTINSKYYAVTN